MSRTFLTRQQKVCKDWFLERKHKGTPVLIELLHLIEGAVKYYFQNFEIIMEKYILPEANIYSVDEMGISTVQEIDAF